MRFTARCGSNPDWGMSVWEHKSDTRHCYALYMFPSTAVLKNHFLVKVYETGEKESIFQWSAAASAVTATCYTHGWIEQWTLTCLSLCVWLFSELVVASRHQLLLLPPLLNTCGQLAHWSLLTWQPGGPRYRPQEVIRLITEKSFLFKSEKRKAEHFPLADY